MKKSIIFDLDGTLWDTSKEIEQIWKKVAQDYYIEFNEEKIKQIMGFTKKEIIEYLFKGNSEKGNEFITECQENENKYLRKNGGYIYKNTIKTLKDLSKNWYKKIPPIIKSMESLDDKVKKCLWDTIKVLVVFIIKNLPFLL